MEVLNIILQLLTLLALHLALDLGFIRYADKLSNLHILVLERRQLKLLHYDRITCLVQTCNMFLNLFFIHGSRTVSPLGALHKLASWLTPSELLSNFFITFSLFGVDRRCTGHSWLLAVNQSHFLHFLLHLFDLSVDTSLLKLELSDLLINFILVFRALFVFLP